MFLSGMGKVTRDYFIKEEPLLMDSTNDFLNKLHDKQRKDEQNRKRQGKNNPSEKLPTNRDKG
jgi:hypothetical protein